MNCTTKTRKTMEWKICSDLFHFFLFSFSCSFIVIRNNYFVCVFVFFFLGFFMLPMVFCQKSMVSCTAHFSLNLIPFHIVRFFRWIFGNCWPFRLHNLNMFHLDSKVQHIKLLFIASNANPFNLNKQTPAKERRGELLSLAHNAL